jgi:hypothetical protein
MKYYIPSSNLNLDNLLQSECILPPGHYAQRISGYKSFEQIEELRAFNSLVLFANPIQFSITDTGRYNFPILIEIEDEGQCSDFNVLQDGVFICNHAINLTPLNCRIYFFSEQAYNITTINTESNKAIKYYRKYHIYPNTHDLKTVPIPRLTTSNVSLPICEDKYIDKQKGALYAYLLGQKMSLTQELAKQQKISQEIYNILTSLISTPSIPSTFVDKLNTLIAEYKQLDLVENENTKIFQENLNAFLGKRFKFLQSCFIEALRKLDFLNLLYKKWNCNLLPTANDIHMPNEYSALRSEIERRTSSAIFKYQQGVCESLNGISINGYSVYLEGKQLINITLQYLIDNDVTPETMVANRKSVYMGIMKNIVPTLKSNMGEENWENSKEQMYVNTLFRHIEDPVVEFKIKGIDDEELQVIACFILKGHSLSDLIAYMNMQELTDYRYALTLWGALCGYMEMNRDSLKPILSDRNYLEVYKMLYGKVPSDISRQENVSKATAITSETELSTNKFDTDGFKFILDKIKFNKGSKELTAKILDQVEKDGLSEKDALEKVLSSKSFKNARKQCDLARGAYKAYTARKEEGRLEHTLEEIGTTKVARKEILTYFGFPEKGYKKKAIRNAKVENPDLFSIQENGYAIQNTPSPEFDKDTSSSAAESPSALPKIPCFESLPMNALERLEQNWKYTGRKYPNDRKEHIRYFINLCKKEGKEGNAKGPTSLTGVLTQELLKQAEYELNEFFSDESAR